MQIGQYADITAISYYGLADGIFASGADVDVTNSGAIEAEGSTWAAGIEAQGSESVTVDNSGDISATAAPFLQVTYDGDAIGSGAVAGQAFGIYATGGEAGAEVTNSGNITVEPTQAPPDAATSASATEVPDAWRGSDAR